MSAVTPTPTDSIALAVVPGEATLDEGRPNLQFETETTGGSEASDSVPDANDNGDGESKGGGAASSEEKRPTLPRQTSSSMGSFIAAGVGSGSFHDLAGAASSADAGAARGGAASSSTANTNTNQVTVEVRAQRKRSGSTTPRRSITAGQSHAPGHALDEDVTLNSILAKGTTADPEALDDAKSFLKEVPGLRHRRNGSRKELASSDRHADAINEETWHRHASPAASGGEVDAEAKKAAARDGVTRVLRRGAVVFEHEQRLCGGVFKNKVSVAAGSRNVGGRKPTMRPLYDSIGTITDDCAAHPHTTALPSLTPHHTHHTGAGLCRSRARYRPSPHAAAYLYLPSRRHAMPMCAAHRLAASASVATYSIPPRGLPLHAPLHARLSLLAPGGTRHSDNPKSLAPPVPSPPPLLRARALLPSAPLACS